MRNRIKVAYIAGPFRAANTWEMEQNIRRAEEAALRAWDEGYAVICPHTNTRFFQGALPDTVWLEGDLEIIRRCDVILMMPDWKKSQGARAEHNLAIREGIPIRYLNQEESK